MLRELILALSLAGAVVPAALAQSLAQRVASAPDGEVEFNFAARPDVCGDGRGMIRSGHHHMWISKNNVSMSDDDEDRDCPCSSGPVRIRLTVRGHRIVDLHTRVGGQGAAAATGASDLGQVPAARAVEYLLSLAANQREDVGKEAIFPATLADSVRVWPALLRIARDRTIAGETRRSAVFWVSQAAGEAATLGLDSLVSDEHGDRDVREQAVFALSQRPKEEGVPVLIRVARTNRDPEIRKKALFWLGQSEDPRALALFEEILTKR